MREKEAVFPTSKNTQIKKMEKYRCQCVDTDVG